MAVEDEAEGVGYSRWPRAANRLDGAEVTPTQGKRRCCRRSALSAEVIAT
jgi:hypothetical protein